MQAELVQIQNMNDGELPGRQRKQWIPCDGPIAPRLSAAQKDGKPAQPQRLKQGHGQKMGQGDTPSSGGKGKRSRHYNPHNPFVIEKKKKLDSTVVQTEVER